MNNLADTVLDLLVRLTLSESGDDEDDDWTIEYAEEILFRIENSYSDEERQALKDAAARSLASWLREPDQHGYTPRKKLSPEHRAYLEACAEGRFDNAPADDED